MAPIIIPEGFVLVKPRSRETAIALLEAADAVGADKHTSVRTVTGGYHVLEEVAAKFQEGFPEADVEEAQERVDTQNQAEDAREQTEDKAEGERTEQADGEKEDGEGLPPLPITADSTHAEIDEYAAGLDPKVEFPANTNKAEKIQLLEAARQPKTAE